MSRSRVIGFADPRTGEWHELRDPDGRPSLRQLAALARVDALVLVEPGEGGFTKAEASYAIAAVVEAGLLEPRSRSPLDPATRFNTVCAAIIAYITRSPGSSGRDVVIAVGGNRAYVGSRVRDLVDLGVLEDRAPRSGPGRARELYVTDAGVRAPAEPGRSA